MKSHAEVQPLDRLELAFYWLLLGRHRTREVKPEGRRALRRDGEHEKVKVPLSRRTFVRVVELIAAVRKTRAQGDVESSRAAAMFVLGCKGTR